MSVFDLTDAEKALVKADIEGIIGADETTVEVFSQQLAGEGTFDGPSFPSQASLGIFSGDLKLQPASDILEPFCDSVIDIHKVDEFTGKKEDRLVIKTAPSQEVVGKIFRIKHIQPHQLGGVKTFIRLQLTHEDTATDEET